MKRPITLAIAASVVVAIKHVVLNLKSGKPSMSMHAHGCTWPWLIEILVRDLRAMRTLEQDCAHHTMRSRPLGFQRNDHPRPRLANTYGYVVPAVFSIKR